MVYYNDYDIKYPDLILKIMDYFDIQNSSVGKIKDKSVLKFCEQFKDGNALIYQPTIINRICKRLCDCGQFECVRSWEEWAFMIITCTLLRIEKIS